MMPRLRITVSQERFDTLLAQAKLHGVAVDIYGGSVIEQSANNLPYIPSPTTPDFTYAD